MRRLALTLSILVLAIAPGCGPTPNPGASDTAPGTGVDSGAGTGQPGGGNSDPPASLRGTVWAPGQAPGMVPVGHEIPIYGALVTLSRSRSAPIPQETYCERCVDPSGVYVLSEHDGSFQLSGLQPDIYWLTIQKGQFRVERQISLESGVLELSADMTTLPSVHDPENGMWIPRIAMAVGQYDHLEDILGKMGLGDVDESGRYVPASAAGILDIYTNGVSFRGGTVQGTLSDLVRDRNRLLQYHIVFIPCSGDAHTSDLQRFDVLRNLRAFVEAGGKLYVTDWSGEWSDNVFPTQITLGDGVDTPASAYDPTRDAWDVFQFGNADGAAYDSNNAEAVDAELAQWLSLQKGPVVEDYEATVPYDPTRFTAEGNWNVIDALTPVELGVDEEGMPIIDMPKTFIIGGNRNSLPKQPLTVTFEPAGCGRVLYSTYHTTDSTHLGLAPQERVLLYLIMEIGVCQSGPIIE